MSSKSKNNNIAVVLGVLFAVINVVVIFSAGSPYNVAHKISIYEKFPPIWLWCFSLIMLGFLIGYAFGNVMCELMRGKNCREREAEAYRGGMLFVATFLLSLAHYPLLFVGERLIAALILAFISLICAALCTLCWAKVSPVSAIIIGVYTAFLVYVFFINCYVVLNI